MQKFTAIIAAALVAISCTGCAMSKQAFVDISYSDNGTPVRIVKGKSITIAPPFGAQAVADHTLEMSESLEGWEINMGSNDKLYGGDITPELLQALRLMLTVP